MNTYLIISNATNSSEHVDASTMIEAIQASRAYRAGEVINEAILVQPR